MSETVDDLFARLKRVVSQVDAVPERVRAAARASETWVSIDAELAELVYDSVVDAELAGVRGTGAARQLTFETTGVSLDVEVSGEPRRLNGQLAPPQQADIEVRHPRGSVTVRSDAHGHFRVEALPRGPVSFACRTPGAGAPVTHTDWVVV